MINYESKFSFRKNQKQSIDVSGNPIPNENKGKLVQNLKQKNRSRQRKRLYKCLTCVFPNKPIF
ncbi:hypothetical protein LEP1GSC064_1090 [Leptospira kirschneri serovar Grippotyphosa str. Moskva]|nr:hypothetical protein LEP1GSC064_1090 [Leptospira kirschneri serovar Grippotyphosa str. Moskva]